MLWLLCRMLQKKTDSVILKSIQTQLDKFWNPKVYVTKKLFQTKLKKEG